MKKLIRAAGLSLALLLTSLPFSTVAEAPSIKQETPADALHSFSTDSGQVLKPFAIGPGLINLSPADEFSTYQWGLKNDGEFRLVELQSKFQSVDGVYNGLRSGTGIGIPKPGPGDYESKVTKAVAGIDIDIQPAWELYDKAENKRSVVVAIIDTGIDINHQELKNSIWTNPGESMGTELITMETALWMTFTAGISFPAITKYLPEMRTATEPTQQEP